MKFSRFHYAVFAAFIAVLPCEGATPAVLDGSTVEKAIPLKQRGTKAAAEEFQWMMKIHGYTPALTMRDALADAVRAVRDGKAKEVNASTNMDHRTIEHGGHWCSYWRFRTPKGTREIYFDTGVSTKTPEVERQEAARANYLQEALGSLKIKL